MPKRVMAPLPLLLVGLDMAQELLFGLLQLCIDLLAKGDAHKILGTDCTAASLEAGGPLPFIIVGVGQW
jgi:hypothetical protein